MSLILVGVGLPFRSPGAPPAGEGYELRFQETFSGPLNTNLWSYREGKRPGMGDYIVNSLNKSDTVSVSKHELHIRCYQWTNDGVVWNVGGGIISKPCFGYGYYECLCKPWMGARGVHTAFWQRGGPEGTVFEIDSSEIDSAVPLASKNLFYLNYLPGATGLDDRTLLDSKATFATNSEGTFLNAYEITPKGVFYWQDGKIVQTVACPGMGACPQQLWLTALNGVNTHGKIPKLQPCETTFQYVRYYAKNYPGVNLLGNGSFELNQDTRNPQKPFCWRVDANPASACLVVKGNAADQNYKLHLGSDTQAFKAEVSQNLQYINNGDYELRWQSRSSGGLKSARIVVSDYGGPDIVREIPRTASWQSARIAKIPVTSHAVKVSILAAGDSGRWLEMDAVRFELPPLPGKKPVQIPFPAPSAPVWQVGTLQPLTLKGTGKGLPGTLDGTWGDAKCGSGGKFSVSFTMTADHYFSGPVVARMAGHGSDTGWAVHALRNGEIEFQVGSAAKHQSLLDESKRYQPGKPLNITCTFDHGRGCIFVNGSQVAMTTNFPALIDDAKTSVMAGSAKFFGTLKNVLVYNRVLPPDEITNLAAAK